MGIDENNIDEAKSFKNTTGIFTLLIIIVCIVLYVSLEDRTQIPLVLPIGGMILAVIHFRMKKEIRKYYESNSEEKNS